jgi:hypothetical protein
MSLPNPIMYRFTPASERDNSTIDQAWNVAGSGSVPGVPVVDPNDPTRLLGWCGEGTDMQPAFQFTQPDGTPRFEIFVAAPEAEAGSWPELNALALETNAQFTKRALPLLERKRKSTGYADLEISSWLSPTGFRLAYVRPVKRRKLWRPGLTAASQRRVANAAHEALVARAPGRPRLGPAARVYKL